MNGARMSVGNITGMDVHEKTHEGHLQYGCKLLTKEHPLSQEGIGKSKKKL